MNQPAATGAPAGASAPTLVPPAAAPPAAPGRPAQGAMWINLVIAALLMAATMPGRTQGLGLITEPMLRDLGVDHLSYSYINLWATLGGGALCIPVGYLIDRLGLRAVAVGLLLALGATVWQLSVAAGGWLALFILILLTRAFGQSGLSVVSITTASAAARRRYGLMMGIYSVVLTVFFVAAFMAVPARITAAGWRMAWLDIAIALVFVIAPITLLFLRENRSGAGAGGTDDADGSAAGSPSHTLLQALATPTFWIFGCAVALYGLVSSGLGLFAQAVLAERGFDATVFYSFYTYSLPASLAGQLLCGWLALRYPLSRLLTAAMAVYALALALLPGVSTLPLFYVFTVLAGVSGGFIAVLFYAVWKPVFGTAQLGRIQGAAQSLTVLASATGPLVFAECQSRTGSYSPVLFALAAVVALLAALAWRVRMPAPA
jgi:MFS family permease